MIGVDTQREQSILIRPRGRTGGKHTVPPTQPCLHLRIGDRLTLGGTQYEPLDLALSPTAARDDGQVAHPKVRKRDLVVRVAETGISARDEKVESRRQILGDGQPFDSFSIVFGRRQIG